MCGLGRANDSCSSTKVFIGSRDPMDYRLIQVGRQLRRSPVQRRVSSEDRQGCSVCAWKPSGTETAQPLSAACSTVLRKSLYLVWTTSFVPTYVCCLSSFHNALLKSWLHPPDNLLWVWEGCCWVLLKPSLLCAELVQFPPRYRTSGPAPDHVVQPPAELTYRPHSC